VRSSNRGHRESAHPDFLDGAAGSIMYRREVVDRKIVDLQRILASTDDQLTITLLNMAIESFESERDALLQTEQSAGLRELDG
jgi:hypothetical protein